jgi:chromosomal replication initiation ATPase DnaA
MSAQLPLPLEPQQHYTREDFIVGPGNSQAVEFLDAWPNWPAASAALFGPSGAGKTHLAQVWAVRTGACILEATTLDEASEIGSGAVVLENVGNLTDAGERAVFALIERGEPLLLTGRDSPHRWPVRLPDLASRYHALLSFALWTPDDALLETLAKKLFAVRQLTVPASVAAEMVKSLERSPAAMRDFVMAVDREALARKRPVSLSLVKDLLAKQALG